MSMLKLWIKRVWANMTWSLAWTVPILRRWDWLEKMAEKLDRECSWNEIDWIKSRLMASGWYGMYDKDGTSVISLINFDDATVVPIHGDGIYLAVYNRRTFPVVMTIESSTGTPSFRVAGRNGRLSRQDMHDEFPGVRWLKIHLPTVAPTEPSVKTNLPVVSKMIR